MYLQILKCSSRSRSIRSSVLTSYFSDAANISLYLYNSKSPPPSIEDPSELESPSMASFPFDSSLSSLSSFITSSFDPFLSFNFFFPPINVVILGMLENVLTFLYSFARSAILRFDLIESLERVMELFLAFRSISPTANLRILLE